MTIPKVPNVSVAAAVLLGVILAVYAVQKVAQPLPTLDVLGQVWGFSGTWQYSLFILLVAAEAAVAGALLLWPGHARAAWAGIALLVAVLTSPLLQWYTGSDLLCGCGSTPGILGESRWATIFRNASYILLGIVAWRGASRGVGV